MASATSVGGVFFVDKALQVGDHLAYRLGAFVAAFAVTYGYRAGFRLSTNLGDAQWLYRQIQAYRADIGLRLIHHSYTTLTGADEVTEMRLKYVELWFSARLADLWEVRKSWGESLP
jgi:hypothetical protein